jgi:glucosamine--fructose-6-phosphate aminotransferase (isomerizing)
LTSNLEREIQEQPDVLRTMLDAEQAAVARAATAIRAYAPRFVVIAARGSSDNAARYGQYLFGAINRLSVALATPSLFTLYQSPPRLADALVIGVSQSGQSPDIVAVLAEGRQQGALTLAVTNEPDSSLAAQADHVIQLHAGQEQSIASTKTYTASLVALALLSVALDGNAGRRQALEAVPQLVADTLAAAGEVAARAERYRYMDTCVVIGRGYNYATAFEIALKLKELTYVVAEPYSSADFRHGPVALVEHGFPVIAVVPDGVAAPEMLRLLDQLCERQAELIVISNHSDALAQAVTPLPLPAGVPEWLSPIIAVLPGQLFTLALTLARGYDPDHPRGLRKVTLTR